MKARIFLPALLIAAFCLISTGYSQVPQMMNYQGVLTDSSGNRLNGNYNMTFSVYDTSDGGTPLWIETQYEVFVDQGVFNVLLSIPDSVWCLGEDELIPRRYLGVSISSEPEMVPRRAIGSVPYAYRAGPLALASDDDWYFPGDGNTTEPYVSLKGDDWGIARNSASTLLGNYKHTHTNLGVTSTTGSGTEPNNAYCTVAGGVNNTADGGVATIGGGALNYAGGPRATVGGGGENNASGGAATIGGGSQNEASGNEATIGGGFGNIASGVWATVGGGEHNEATDHSATVGGGRYNDATNNDATVGGGQENAASGNSATVPGGFGNTAGGDYSFAAGRRAKANHSGTFVWADNTDADFTSTGNNQFLIRASGGVGIGTTNPSEAIHINTRMDDVIQIGRYTAFGQEWSSGATVVGDNVKPDDLTQGMEIISDHPDVGGRAIRMSLADGIAFHGKAGDVDPGDTFDNELMRITNTGKVGIGTKNPAQKLDVVGTAQMTGFKMPTGAANGYVLTSNASGVGTWQAAGSEIGGGGTTNYIPKFTGSTSIGNSVLYESGGNIGIGTTNPAAKVHIGDPFSTGTIPEKIGVLAKMGGPNSPSIVPGEKWGVVSYGETGGVLGSSYLTGILGVTYGVSLSSSGVYGWNPNRGLSWAGCFDGNVFIDGKVGISTLYPQARLHIAGTSQGDGVLIGDNFRMREFSDNFGSNTFETFFNPTGGHQSKLVLFGNQSSTMDLIVADGKVGIGTTNPSEELTIKGSGVMLKAYNSSNNVVFEIGEGFDYSETFPTSEAKITPGTVMVIDPDKKGYLAVSTEAYDKKVVGIVAGANGLGSGVRLGSSGEDSDAHAVALVGRVYCNVDTQYGDVQPGDFLTTSPTPGHAMVVRDFSKAQGAVLGKAMEGLSGGGKGQILVLVSSQ